MRGLDDLAIDADMAAGQQALNRGAGNVRQFCAKKNVQSTQRERCINNKYPWSAGHDASRLRIAIITLDLCSPGRGLLAPGDKDQESDAGAYGAIGKIEGGEANLLATPPVQIKPKEVR